ncbi:MAG: DUF362 domain-containing protein [Fusicatenibacter saccharivorans]
MGTRWENECIGCKLCFSVCPQKCIDITRIPAVIDQHQCLHCGRCAETCPRGTIRKRGQQFPYFSYRFYGNSDKIKSIETMEMRE